MIQDVRELYEARITLLDLEIKNLMSERESIMEILGTYPTVPDSIPVPHEELEKERVLRMSITDLKSKGYMSERTSNLLLRAGIKAVRDLWYVCETDIKEIRGVGNTAFHEIQKFCDTYDIVIGKFIKWIPVFQKGEKVNIYGNSDKIAAGYSPDNLMPIRGIQEGTVIERIDDVWSIVPQYKCNVYRDSKFYEIKCSVGELERAIG